MLSLVWLLVTPWTVAHQALLSMRLPRQEYWSGLTFPSPGNLSDPGITPVSPTLQADPGWATRKLNIKMRFKWKNIWLFKIQFSSVQSLSHVRLFATPWIAARQASVHHQLPESSIQTHARRVSDAIQPSHPLSSPSPPAPNPSQLRKRQMFLWLKCFLLIAVIFFWI